MSKRWQGIIWFGAVFGLDRVAKWLVVESGLPYTLNPGIAFGWHVPLSLGLAVLLLTALLWWWWQQPNLAVVFVLAGGVGNLWDRLLMGAVIDWLPMPIIGGMNNLADYAIVVGVMGLLIANLQRHQIAKTSSIH